MAVNHRETGKQRENWERHLTEENKQLKAEIASLTADDFDASDRLVLSVVSILLTAIGFMFIREVGDLVAECLGMFLIYISAFLMRIVWE